MLCNVAVAKPWELAALDCAAHGMYLMIADDPNELQWLASMVSPALHPEWVSDVALGTRLWVGGFARQATFVWQTDATIPAELWAPGEPSLSHLGAPEHCVHYWNFPPERINVLNDAACALKLPYVCEFPAP